MLNTHLFANPEIELTGNANSIIAGALSTNTVNNTNFGTVNLGNNSIKSYLIQNSGIGTLSVTSVNVSGLNSADYTLTLPAPNFTVAANGVQSFSITFTPGAAGTRTAQITVNNNDLNEGAYSFIVEGNGHNISTGLSQLENGEFDLSFFPNPAKNEIQFSIPAYLSGSEIEMIIFDVTGKIVSEKKNADLTKTGQLNRSVNISDLNNGIYTVNLVSEKKIVASKKLVVTK
jgi:hypothetical protein